MKQLIVVLLAFLLLTTSTVYAQPVQSAPYTGTPASTSSGDVLWSQLDDPTGSGFSDQAFEAGYAAYDNSGADDFVTPFSNWLAYPWNLQELYSPGEQSVPAGSPAFINIAFYHDAGGLPGSVVCDFPANTDFTLIDGDLTIDLAGCSLWSETDHWFSQQVRMDFNPFGQHFWATRNTANLNPGLWKNPGNGFGNGCLDWQPANAVCGMTGEDWMFELSGSQPDPPDPEGIPAIGPFGVVVMVLVLGGGSAYVLRRRR